MGPNFHHEQLPRPSSQDYSRRDGMAFVPVTLILCAAEHPTTNDKPAFVKSAVKNPTLEDRARVRKICTAPTNSILLADGFKVQGNDKKNWRGVKQWLISNGSIMVISIECHKGAHQIENHVQSVDKWNFSGHIAKDAKSVNCSLSNKETCVLWCFVCISVYVVHNSWVWVPCAVLLTTKWCCVFENFHL